LTATYSDLVAASALALASPVVAADLPVTP
jgi:hypothetical protein